MLKKYEIENEDLLDDLLYFVMFSSMEVVFAEDPNPDILGRLGGHKVDVARNLNPEL